MPCGTSTMNKIFSLIVFNSDFRTLSRKHDFLHHFLITLYFKQLKLRMFWNYFATRAKAASFFPKTYRESGTIIQKKKFMC